MREIIHISRIYHFQYVLCIVCLMQIYIDFGYAAAPSSIDMRKLIMTIKGEKLWTHLVCWMLPRG